MPVPAIKILINERNMAGNPVIARLWTSKNQSARYIVRLLEQIDPEWDGKILYTGEVYSDGGWAKVDLSSIFINRHQTAGAAAYFISLYDINTGNEYAQTQFLIYAGGISKILSREALSTPNMGNIFDFKLKNVESNFLLTTRTSDFYIFIPEGELMPLYYYSQGMKFSVTYNGNVLLSRDHTTEINETISFIDLNALRQTHAISHNRLPSEFRILNDNGWSFTIVILNSEFSRYSLKFKNSFGAYEMVSLIDDLEYKPQLDETVTKSVYDNAIYGFKNIENRKVLTNRFVGYTLPLNIARRMFLIDLLLSDEVYFVANNRELRCNVKSDIDNLIRLDKYPVQLPITIELSDNESRYSPIYEQSIYNIIVENENLSVNNSEVTV